MSTFLSLPGPRCRIPTYLLTAERTHPIRQSPREHGMLTSSYAIGHPDPGRPMQDGGPARSPCFSLYADSPALQPRSPATTSQKYPVTTCALNATKRRPRDGAMIARCRRRSGSRWTLAYTRHRVALISMASPGVRPACACAPHARARSAVGHLGSSFRFSGERSNWAAARRLGLINRARHDTPRTTHVLTVHRRGGCRLHDSPTETTEARPGVHPGPRAGAAPQIASCSRRPARPVQNAVARPGAERHHAGSRALAPQGSIGTPELNRTEHHSETGQLGTDAMVAGRGPLGRARGEPKPAGGCRSDADAELVGNGPG
ncbi:hypothetical protein DENSPDRAFT_228520 [Dentipellis sp. KUC8613]|nr:hypothetical protein DENSPDRAFT_228520 [Dentipellis sp. KUC8613]